MYSGMSIKEFSRSNPRQKNHVNGPELLQWMTDLDPPINLLAALHWNSSLNHVMKMYKH